MTVAQRPGAVAAVALVDVLDHLLAPLVLEIDVDVGRLVRAASETKRSKTIVPISGRDRGDAEAVADDRIGRRAAALAEDAARAGEVDDVVDGEEVGRVAELADQRELVFENAARPCRGRRRGSASFSPSWARRRRRWAAALSRRDLGGVFVAQLVEREGAAGGDLARAVDGVLVAGEEAAHLGLRPQAAFGIGERGAAEIVDAARPCRIAVRTSVSRRRRPWCMSGAAVATVGDAEGRRQARARRSKRAAVLPVVAGGEEKVAGGRRSGGSGGGRCRSSRVEPVRGGGAEAPSPRPIRSGRRAAGRRSPFSARSRPSEMSRQSRPQAARSRGRAVTVKPSVSTIRRGGDQARGRSRSRRRRGAFGIVASGRGGPIAPASARRRDLPGDLARLGMGADDSGDRVLVGDGDARAGRGARHAPCTPRGGSPR